MVNLQLLPHITLVCGGFEHTSQYPTANVVYYFGPPYKLLSDTSAFPPYHKGGFNDSELDSQANGQRHKSPPAAYAPDYRMA
ncbi:MAG: hypothetical protein SPJ13_06465 [Bacteroidales bacterium]|nr:hypothetical protein [Bacteroidales bacterium]